MSAKRVKMPARQVGTSRPVTLPRYYGRDEKWDRQAFLELYGFWAPANHEGVAGEQFSYKRSGKRVDQDARVAALTGLASVEVEQFAFAA